MAYRMYPYGYRQIQIQSLNYLTSTIQAVLLLDSYTYDRTHQFVSSVVAHEVAGTTRQTVGGKAITDNGTNQIGFLASAQTFPTPTAGQNVGYVAFFQRVTDDTDSVLIMLQDPTNLTANAQDIVNNVATAGLFALSY